MAKALKLNINGEYELLELEEIKERIYTSDDYRILIIEKIRERYTLNEELAIQRQRDTKIQEFEDYNAYCEECKRQARITCNMDD